MRILHVVRSVDPREGGPIEGVKLLAQAHRGEGRRIEVVSLDGPNDPWVQDFPVPLTALGPVRSKYGYTPRLAPWLAQNAAAFNAVIVNGIWQYGGLAVWRTLRKAAMPYFVFPHGMLDPWFKQAYPLKHLKKWMYWPWAEYRVLRDARAVLFTCEQERQLARESFWLYRCREAVVGYGTRLPVGDAVKQRTAFLHAFPECRDQRLWLFLGRLHEKKGCDLLLHSFAATEPERHGTRLVMAGPDSTGWQKKLQRMASDLGIADRITWPGMLTGDLKWGALHAAEVFTLPSHQENFGLVVAEALSCGLPVLISDKVNIWREIEADEAGFVASDTQSGATDLAQRWLQLPAERRLQMRANARKSFTTRFQIEHVAHRLAEQLRSMGVNG